MATNKKNILLNFGSQEEINQISTNMLMRILGIQRVLIREIATIKLMIKSSDSVISPEDVKSEVINLNEDCDKSVLDLIADIQLGKYEKKE